MKKTVAFPQYNQAQVLIVGDVMLDRYWHGKTKRISPEAPVPIVNVGQQEDRPGGAANVALNIAALGSGATITGLTGDDEACTTLETVLQSAGVATAFVKHETLPTITKLRVLSQHQQLIRMDFEEKFDAEQAAPLAETVDSILGNVKAVILSDYAKGTLSDPQGLIRLANQSGVPVLIDPKGSDFIKYKGATLLTPNMCEFEAVVGECLTEEDIVEKGQALMTKLDLKALLITRSEHGMTLLKQGEGPLHLPARAREVYDVTGAGDTVIATVASSLAAGVDLADAVALANIAAGIVVGKLGTATVSGPELRRAIQKDQGVERGVLTEKQLLVALEDARAHGEKIVMTNGCFDIIHAGHVGYLEQAKALGDRLIVAVNSDASVKKLKGEGRPINPQDRRMTVLAALESTDWVVVFDDDTPEGLLELFKPDVLVKGGDYGVDQVVGKHIVDAYGGQVQVLNFFDNCSTTAIVDQIKSQ